MNRLIIFLCGLFFCFQTFGKTKPSYVDYVNPLTGTQSTHDLSAGNLYPAIAVPWGMNFWTPQTGKMGDGWTYTYTENKIEVSNRHTNPVLGSTITELSPSCQ